MSSEIANLVEIYVALATVTLLIAAPGFAHVERGAGSEFCTGESNYNRGAKRPLFGQLKLTSPASSSGIDRLLPERHRQ